MSSSPKPALRTPPAKYDLEFTQEIDTAWELTSKPFDATSTEFDFDIPRILGKSTDVAGGKPTP